MSGKALTLHQNIINLCSIFHVNANARTHPILSNVVLVSESKANRIIKNFE